MDSAPGINELIDNFSYLHLPIGVYFVAPDGRFFDCNRSVRQMLALPLDGPVAASIADFYASPSQRSQLLEKAAEVEARGGYLEKQLIHFRVKGHDIYVENYCRSVRDPATNEIVGYAGCIVDVTAEHEAEKREDELQHKVEELTLDIGRVLHANTTTLVMAQQTLDAVVEALGPGQFQDLVVPPAEEADELLVQEAARLAGAVEHLSQTGTPERRLEALPAAKWEVLAARAVLLRQIREVVKIPEMRLPTLRKAAHEIAEICRDVQTRRLAREVVRDALQAAAHLEQLACLIDVLNTRNAIIQMDLSLRALRDFITSDVRSPELKTRLPVSWLIEQAISQLAEFARTSGVEIVRRDRGAEAEVEGSERDLARTLSNLLHNAIKYTWKRDRAGAPWVMVRTQVHDRMVCIDFENWGVPISEDELKKGLIFQLGYRGIWSTDRGRLGTGIGLTDAQRVAYAHGGELRVNSKPASFSPYRPEDAAYYKQPFVTTVTLCLPVAGKPGV
jgi:signal transduction histidine kinase